MGIKFTEMVKLSEMAKLSIDARQDADVDYKSDVKSASSEGGQNKAIQYAFKYWPALALERDKLEELDKYVGYYGHRNTKKADITVLFDTNSDKIKKGDVIAHTEDNDALWREIEMRNEAELCKRAMEEYDVVSEEIKGYLNDWKEWHDNKNRKVEDNPLKKAVKALSTLAGAGKTLHIDYMFLQACYGVYGGAFGTGDHINIVGHGFFGKRFMEQLGLNGEDRSELWQAIYEVGYFSFLFGKDIWGAQNDSRTYSLQFDDTANAFDRTNRNSKIVHVVEQFEKHPFDFDNRFEAIMSSSKTGTRKYLDPRKANLKKGKDEKEVDKAFDKYALWLCKGRYTQDEIRDIMAEDFASEGKEDIENAVEERMNKILKDDVPYISENFWTTTTAKPLITLAANFATMNFDNAKKTILNLPSKENNPIIRLWLENPEAYKNGLGLDGKPISDPEELTNLKDLFDRTYKNEKDFYNAYNAQSMNATMSGKDGDSDTEFGDTIADTRNLSQEDNIDLEDIKESVKKALLSIAKSFDASHPICPGTFELILALLKYPFLENYGGLAKTCPHLYSNSYCMGTGKNPGKKVTIFDSKTIPQFFSNYYYGGWIEGHNGTILRPDDSKNESKIIGLGDAGLLSDVATIINNLNILDKDESLRGMYEKVTEVILPSKFKDCYGIDYVDTSKNIKVPNMYNPGESVSVPPNIFKQISKERVNLSDLMASGAWKQMASSNMNAEYRYLATEKAINRGTTQVSARDKQMQNKGFKMKTGIRDEFDESIFIDIYNSCKLN